MNRLATVDSSSQKPRGEPKTIVKRKVKSYVWHYFDRIDDTIKCRVCQREMKAPKNYSTSSLIRHLEYVHALKKRGVFVKDISSLPTISQRPGRVVLRMRERVFANFEEDTDGFWRCKKCDYTCQALNLFQMFHHLTTVHCKGTAPTTNEIFSQNGDTIVENAPIELNTGEQNSENDVSDDSTRFVYMNSKIDPEKAEADASQTFGDIDNDSGPSHGGNNSILLGELLKGSEATENYESETNSNDDIGNNAAQGEDAVDRKHDYKLQDILPIVLVERCSSNVQRPVEDRNVEESGNDVSHSRASIDYDRRKFDHWYSKGSGGKPIVPPSTQRRAQRRLTPVRKRNNARSEVRIIKSEELDPEEFELQVPLQYETSFTAKDKRDSDGQTSMSYSCIQTDKAGEKQNVAVITLNRPNALNALCKKLVDELNDAVTKFDSDDSIGAIIITGNEKAFAAGTDIREMQNYTYAQAVKKKFLISWNGISRASKPIIAAVNGYALGGGCELALMCDIIYAGETACFGQPEIVIGTISGAGGTQRLTRAIGKSKAMEMILTGNQMSAVEAEKSGLVSKIFPPKQLLSEAIKLGERISTHSQVIVSMAKEAVNSAYETTLQAGLRFEKKLFCGTFATADREEGMAAFSGKRMPKFKNA